MQRSVKAKQDDDDEEEDDHNDDDDHHYAYAYGPGGRTDTLPNMQLGDSDYEYHEYSLACNQKLGLNCEWCEVSSHMIF
ncbi:hypothetical protein PoB_005661500 [Plakobranchus ocellatus]|uniref:Uncharacterized protein n=1 Tax=Plakobranchus ocellatus TaxID=259542 RepID=A0AAV4CEI4_9GAST|nr:hypothetical protein PoB_005661500 [Plakobranchus ocellatus]